MYPLDFISTELGYSSEDSYQRASPWKTKWIQGGLNTECQSQESNTSPHSNAGPQDELKICFLKSQ